MSRIGAGGSLLLGGMGVTKPFGSIAAQQRVGVQGQLLQQRLAAQQWEMQKQQMEQAQQAQAAGIGGLRGLVGQYNRAYGAARRANEARYRQLLRIANRTTGQREADIRRDYAGQQADIMQGLARQGMAGTTIAPTMQMGVQREQQEALNRLADTMQQTKLGIIERREDRYPDPNVIMSLASALGQGGIGALGGLRLG